MKKRILILTLLLTLTLSAASDSRAEGARFSMDQAGFSIGHHAQTGMVNFFGAGSINGIMPETGLGIGFSAADHAAQHLDAYAPIFGENDPRRNLQLVSTLQPRRGQETLRYQQTHQGIPILAGEIILNITTEGGLLSISGELSPELDLSIAPKLSAADARQKVLDLISISYQLEAGEIEITTPELWIFDERLLAPSDRPAELVWRIEARAPSLPINELVLVNANTGAISLHFNQIDTSGAAQDNSTENLDPDRENLIESESRPAVSRIEEAPISLIPSNHLSTPEYSVESVNTWYVSTAGDDLNDCLSPTTPCASINRALIKPGFLSGDLVLVSEGEYTGTGDYVILLDNSVSLSGGWNPDFSLQIGYSTIDGEDDREGLTKESDVMKTINLENFIFIQGNPNLYLESATGTIQDCIIQDGNGVGVTLNDAGMVLNHVDISDNDDRGMEIFLHGSEDIVVISNSLISNNQESGINAVGSNLRLENVTISGNGNSATEGGGIRYKTVSGVSALLNNVTITENTAQSGGGLFTEGNLTLQNSIITNNNATHLASSDCYGDPISNGYNFIGNNLGCGIEPLEAEGDHLNEFLYLAPLADYGGKTRTHALLAGSPAIDAGSPDLPGSSDFACAVTDQRDQPRPFDGDSDTHSYCDPGAYEHQGPEITPSHLFSLNREEIIFRIDESQPDAFEVLILGPNGGEVAGISVTFTAPLSGPRGTFTASGTNTRTISTDSGGRASSGEFVTNSDHG
ncbi:MAG: choice-of-anchor Q domain-containing protein, partial [Chloroflexota bacterium]